MLPILLLDVKKTKIIVYFFFSYPAEQQQVFFVEYQGVIYPSVWSVLPDPGLSKLDFFQIQLICFFKENAIVGGDTSEKVGFILIYATLGSLVGQRNFSLCKRFPPFKFCAVQDVQIIVSLIRNCKNPKCFFIEKIGESGTMV